MNWTVHCATFLDLNSQLLDVMKVIKVSQALNELDCALRNILGFELSNFLPATGFNESYSS